MAMPRKVPVALALLFGSSSLVLFAYAEEHGRRAEPPPFQRHVPGPHPNGPTVRPHSVRVLQPRSVEHGRTGWAHWSHPDFPRPNYYWDWVHVHTVTCTAEDSYGDQYPVSESAPPSFGLANMTDVEDDALDRCYSESGQDSTCALLSCTHI
jgi:hypothetical protein